MMNTREELKLKHVRELCIQYDVINNCEVMLLYSTVMIQKGM